MTTFSLIKRSHSILAAFTLAAGFLALPQWAAAQASAASAATAAPAVQAAPVPAAVAPVAEATTSKETVDNPYGLSALWNQGDFVARGTLLILVIMSMGSWYILITKLYESFKIGGEAKQMRKGFFKSASLNDATKALKDGSAFRFIAE